MKELTLGLDLDQEVAALASFVSMKWTPIAGITELFTEIRTAALWAGRAWFDKHLVWEAATRMEDAREELLKDAVGGGDAPYYDAYCTLLSQLSRATDDAREAALMVDGKWDFERRTKQLTTAVMSKYPDLYTSRPLGWDALAENYCDFDGQEEYDPRPDRELFQGVKVQGTLSADFPGRVALPYVMYDEKCQSMKAYQVLVGAVFAHFLGIAEFINTRRLIEDLKAAVSPDVGAREVLFERKVETANPLLQFMLSDIRPAPTKAEFDEAQVQRAAWNALTEAERKAREADSAKEVSDLLASLLRGESRADGTADYNRREAERAEKGQRLNALLAAARS